MKSSSRFLITTAALVCVVASATVWPLFRPVDAQQQPSSSGKSSRDTPAQASARALAVREEAYRANNLGVALLEQFNHREGAEAFRRALALDPQLRIARINLAIALYNAPDIPAALREAEAAAALAPESAQPPYMLGLIARVENRTGDALAAFRRVLALDPRDVGAHVNLGQLHAQQRNFAEAVAAFRAALAAEPYNGTALYGLANALLRSGQRAEGARLMQRFQELRQTGAATAIGQNYLEQGRYAEAVASTGAEPELVNRQTPDVVFRDATSMTLPPAVAASTSPAVSDDLSDDALNDASNRRNPVRASGSMLGGTINAGQESRIRCIVARALGGAATFFDYDSDGDLDLFEADDDGRRLYRNDGGKYADVTEASGLRRGTQPTGAVSGAVAGDYDNDERPDLLLVGDGALTLYRNEGNGRFASSNALDGIDALKNFPLSISASLLDADHDGDLDVFVAALADLSKRPALPRSLRYRFPYDFVHASNVLLRNNGNNTFTDITAQAGLAGGRTRVVAVVPTDYDNRRDVDLLVVNHDTAPVQLFRNMRDGTFRDVAPEVGIDVRGYFTCAAAGDINKDDYTDFFFGATNTPGLFALSDGQGRFKMSPAPAATEGANAAQFLDYDNDGLLDLVALTGTGARVWRNVGDGWTDASARAFGGSLTNQTASRETLHRSLLASGDVDGDGDTDLLLRASTGAFRLARNEGGNRQASVRVRLAGKVSNRSAVGAKVEARSGSLRQKFETSAASPAPMPADIVFGLGARARTDAVRVIWPAGIVQSETSATPAASVNPAGAAHVNLLITELDRKPSSCPYLYAWNGERFEFVTDFMGGGELGYWAAPGVRAMPDPDEYVRIRGDQLRPRDGRYELRITNELEEALFMDKLELVAVAHPAGVEVYPNEGLGNPTSARFTLYATRDARPPLAATDEHGHDVLARVTKIDRTYPDDFQLRRIRGYAEPHALTLDLARARASSVKHDARTLLLLTGWTDYAFSSDNVAAAQGGMSLVPPALQVKDARGRWQTVIEDIGVPVGRPQTVAVDVTGKFLSASREVRIVTNMRIYWDQILLDDSGGAFPTQLARLKPMLAHLRWRGFSAEATPDGREPFGYDYARVSFTSLWKTFPGRYTREGDVRPLLDETDDMFIVSRPGDEIAVAFDADALPALPHGWTRTFLLYADGFSKEMDINSASPDHVAPLPFHAMKNYPYAAPEAYPSTPAHRDYIERYNTRVVAAPVPRVEAVRRRP